MTAVTDIPMLGGDWNISWEVEHALWDEAEARSGIAKFYAENPERALLSVGRTLARLAADDAQLARYRREVLEEIDEERARLQAKIAILDSTVEACVLEKRARDEGNSLTIPGVGTWSSKSVPASWATEDEAAVIASLARTPDEFNRLTEDQTRRVLLKDDFKKYLDETGLSAFPGMRRTDEHISVKSPFKESK